MLKQVAMFNKSYMSNENVSEQIFNEQFKNNMFFSITLLNRYCNSERSINVT